MRVLMFGWEFPPFSSGGLGTACKGLTSALSKIGAKVSFIAPKGKSYREGNFELIVPGEVSARISSTAYSTPNSHPDSSVLPSNTPSLYGSDLFKDVELYGNIAGSLSENIPHDVIHAHDWLTFRAGIKAKSISGKPLVVHVHATEFDRTGGNPHPAVYRAELEGMMAADSIVAVSNYTKEKIVEHYGIPPEKIHVVHNAVEDLPHPPKPESNFPFKTVLFLGRLTLQKGPDYFIRAAKRVLEVMPETRFVVAGNGDMERYLIEEAARLGISDKVLFAGFIKREELSRAYSMADLYVMPSVSEPFGIAALEAIKSGTPVLVSKQSGVREVFRHCLLCDFWDTEEMAAKIIAALNYPSLHSELRKNGEEAVSGIRWERSAERCMQLYSQLTSQLPQDSVHAYGEGVI